MIAECDAPMSIDNGHETAFLARASLSESCCAIIKLTATDTYQESCESVGIRITQRRKTSGKLSVVRPRRNVIGQQSQGTQFIALLASQTFGDAVF